MNIIPEHDRKLAETLKALSLEPSPQTRTPPPREFRRRLLSGCLLALAAGATVAVPLISPDAADRLGAFLWQPAPGGEPATVEAAARQSAQPLSQAATRNDGSATLMKPSSDVPREVTGSGYVVAPHSVSVFSKYEGRIMSVGVEIGQHVVAGEILVTLEDAGAGFALEQALAERVLAGLVVEACEIELAQIGASFRRSEALAASHSISTQDLEKAATARKSALNGLAQARQRLAKATLEVRIAQERVDALVVRAPMTGTVTALDAHGGDMVLARVDSVLENQMLLAITDTSRLVIDADVAETSIGVLRPGLPGEAVLDGVPDRPFGVEILRIAPVASAEKGTVTLRLALSNPPDGIRPNMAARIRLENQIGETSQ